MARQWQVARVNMKAVKNFEEGKETTEVNPTEEKPKKHQENAFVRHREEEEQKSWLSQKNFFSLTQFVLFVLLSLSNFSR